MNGFRQTHSEERTRPGLVAKPQVATKHRLSRKRESVSQVRFSSPRLRMVKECDFCLLRNARAGVVDLNQNGLILSALAEIVSQSGR